MKVTLKAGVAGKARITAQASGIHVGLHPLPAAQPLTLQLRSSDGLCWEFTFSAPARRNQPGTFIDRAD